MRHGVSVLASPVLACRLGVRVRGEVCGMGRTCSDDSVCTVSAHACSLAHTGHTSPDRSVGRAHAYVDMAHVCS